MTEAEWLAATNPWPMFKFLRDRRQEFPRKFWLYGAACCRRILPLITPEVSRRAVEAAEAFADGRLSRLELEAISEEANHLEGIDEDIAAAAAASAVDYVAPDGWANSSTAGENAAQAVADAGGGEVAQEAELAAQAALMRDLFGLLPFRALPIDTTWFSWNDGTIPKLAQTIYDNRAFDRLPILADALEEAGCSNIDILNHCRQPGEHVRGCWVIDLLLKKK